MYEALMSWPWWVRAIVGAATFMIVFSPYYIMLKLDRVIKLLERANELEWDKQLRQRKPYLFDD